MPDDLCVIRATKRMGIAAEGIASDSTGWFSFEIMVMSMGNEGWSVLLAMASDR